MCHRRVLTSNPDQPPPGISTREQIAAVVKAVAQGGQSAKDPAGLTPPHSEQLVVSYLQKFAEVKENVMLKAMLACLALVMCAASALADAEQVCKQGKDFDLRVRACTDIISRDGKAAWAYHMRGLAHQSKRDYDRAIADYSQAIGIDPQDAFARIDRGSMHRLKGDHDRAIADFTSAIEIVQRGTRTDAKSGSKDSPAAKTVAGALEVMKEYEDSLVLLNAYAGRGDTYFAKGDYDRAVADYSKWIEIDATSAAYHHRGLAYEGKGDHDRAIADFRRALAIDPKLQASADALKRLGAP